MGIGGMDLNRLFARVAGSVARAAGTPVAFLLCVVVVVAWAASGSLFNFSDTWQLVINTGTTIVTFLMVFLIQNTQNRDGAAIQIKLDELILTSKAENEFIGIEKLTDKELESLRSRCAEQAHKSQQIIEKADAELHARRSTPKAPEAANAAKAAKAPAAKTAASRSATKSAPRRKTAAKKAG
jgi:low affinity Fe/Cu permease